MCVDWSSKETIRMVQFTDDLHNLLVTRFGADRVVYDVDQDHVEIFPGAMFHKVDLEYLAKWCNENGGTFFITRNHHEYPEDMKLVLHPVLFG